MGGEAEAVRATRREREPHELLAAVVLRLDHPLRPRIAVRRARASERDGAAADDTAHSDASGASYELLVSPLPYASQRVEADPCAVRRVARIERVLSAGRHEANRVAPRAASGTPDNSEASGTPVMADGTRSTAQSQRRR